jgi:hypothetical protein
MVWLLWSLVLLLGLTGWMSRLDAFWGDDGIRVVHAWLADALLIAIAVHLSGIVAMSWRWRENLVAAMLSAASDRSTAPNSASRADSHRTRAVAPARARVRWSDVQHARSSAALPEVAFAPGEIVIREGGSAGALWILVSGALKVTKCGVVVNSVTRPGALVGEISVLLDTVNGATVEATRASVLRHAVDGKALAPAGAGGCPRSSPRPARPRLRSGS